jgi:very-short-patch-repair endonuclease
MRPGLQDVFARAGGVVRRADHPALARRLDRLRATGQVHGPLPGILTMTAGGEDFQADVLAGQLWAGPDAVLTGRAAARLSFWPEARVGDLHLVVPRRCTRRHGRWIQSHRRIPPEYVWHRGAINFTSPALTAVDLADSTDGGDVIDRALRSRLVRLEDLWEAFGAQPDRLGNARRRLMLRDSRDSPWSEGERDLHRLLRGNRVGGWETNAWVSAGSRGYYADVLFRSERLIAEFDGWEFHRDKIAFDNDRYRRNELVLAGYRVLNFTWRHLTEFRDWVLDCIRRAIDMAVPTGK